MGCVCSVILTVMGCICPVNKLEYIVKTERIEFKS